MLFVEKPIFFLCVLVRRASAAPALAPAHARSGTAATL